MAKDEIPIKASRNPFSGEMTTMISFDAGGIALPEPAKRRMNELDERDLSGFNEGEIIDTVTVDDADPFSF